MNKMKKLFAILIILLTGTRFISGQVQNVSFESFRSEVASNYSDYFSGSGMEESGQFRVTANQNYSQLPASKLRDVMNGLLRPRPEQVGVVVRQHPLQHRGDPLGRGAAQRIDADQQFHQVVVGRVAGRLDDEHVLAALDGGAGVDLEVGDEELLDAGALRVARSRARQCGRGPAG